MIDDGLQWDNSQEFYVDPHVRMALEHVTWKKIFCVLPQRSFLTGRILWLRTAYFAVTQVYRFSDPSVYWAEKDQLLLWKLKGN